MPMIFSETLVSILIQILRIAFPFSYLSPSLHRTPCILSTSSSPLYIHPTASPVPRGSDGPRQLAVASTSPGSSRGAMYGPLLHLHGNALCPLRREQRTRHRCYLRGAGTDPRPAPGTLHHQGLFVCLEWSGSIISRT